MFLSHRGGQTMEMNIVTVYDIQNKFIAYSAPFPDVIDVLSEWGCVYILGGDRKVRSSESVPVNQSYSFVADLDVTSLLYQHCWEFTFDFFYRYINCKKKILRPN